MRRLAELWWLVGVALVAAVLTVSGVLQRDDVQRQHAQQLGLRRQAVGLLRQSVDDVLERERTLAAVIGAQGGRLHGRWPVLASIVTSEPVAHGAGFIEPVTQSDLASFERRTGIRVFQAPRPGVVQPDAVRPIHLVLSDWSQTAPNPPRLGVDLAPNPLRRALLDRAARTSHQLATPPVQFLSGPNPAHRFGVIVYAPVRSSRGRLLGWVTATYQAMQLADLVTSHMPGVRLTIHDAGAVLLSTGEPPRGTRTTIAVAGRRWTVWAAVPATRLPLLPWLVLAFGLCLATAASVILRQSYTRERRATRTLTERDADEAALREIAMLVAQNAPPSAVFAAVAEHVSGLFEAQTAAVSRFDAATNRGTILGGRTRDGTDLAGAVFALDGVTASARVFQTGRMARIDGGYASATDPIAPLMSALSSSGGIAAPVVVAGELWGALGAAYANESIPDGAEARLERFAALVALTISNAEAWDRLARQASSDPLTGLPNRRAFRQRLTAELARAKRHHRDLSLVLIDLDDFKRINDEHGHPEGDRVLVGVAELLKAHAREGEIAARIGGEEFAWLMPETDSEGAYAAAERARVALASESFAGVGPLTCSAGVRSAEPDDEPDTIIRDADQALYQAKRAGRNMTWVAGEQSLRAPTPGA